jgi:hypothetical protein
VTSGSGCTTPATVKPGIKLAVAAFCTKADAAAIKPSAMKAHAVTVTNKERAPTLMV